MNQEERRVWPNHCAAFQQLKRGSWWWSILPCQLHWVGWPSPRYKRQSRICGINNHNNSSRRRPKVQLYLGTHGLDHCLSGSSTPSSLVPVDGAYPHKHSQSLRVAATQQQQQFFVCCNQRLSAPTVLNVTEHRALTKQMQPQQQQPPQCDGKNNTYCSWNV